MTVILPRKAASLANPAPQPLLDSVDGATVILSAGRAAKSTETINNLSTPTMRLPERTPPEMAARMPSVSMALERERQHDVKEAEKKGKTVLVAVVSAIAVLVLIAVGAGWYLTRGSAPVMTPVDASALLAESQASPVALEQSLPALAPVQLEAVPALAPIVLPQVEASKPVSKPVVESVRKLSEEEEYLRQIRRQLGR